MQKSNIAENDLIELFICPCCLRSPIIKETGKTCYCADPTCIGHKGKFSIIADQPVLIDFQNSVFKKEDYTEEKLGKVLTRNKGKFRALISGIIHGDGSITKKQIKHLVQLLTATKKKTNLLIVGGGAIGRGIEEAYNNNNISIVSFDVYLSDNTNFIADAHSIPIKSGSFDAVIVQAVLEHVISPSKVVEEIHRVLKSEGIIYAETPFMQQVHEKAYDFTRFTESGHRSLFKKFDLIASGTVDGPGAVLGWSLRYFFAGLFRSKKMGQLFSLLFFWLRFFDKLMPESYRSDGASGVFFLGKKRNTVISETEIIAFYRGVK